MKTNVPMRLLGSGLALFGTAVAAALPAPQSPAGVRELVTEFVRTQTVGLPGDVAYTVGTLDERTTLPACPAPEAFLPAGARLWGASQVGVRCAAPAPWTIYVPVTVRVTGTVLVTSRPLAAGHILAADDLAPRKSDLTQLPAGVVTDSAQALGRRLASPLAGGQPVRQDLLRAQIAVLQGQTVKLVSRGPGFTVTAEGRALTQAAEGQVAQVRGPAGQTVSGIARSGGVVEVRF